MKKPGKQNNIDISENTTLQNPESGPNRPVSELTGPRRIKKIAYKASLLPSVKGSVITSLIATKGDNDVMSQEHS